MAASYDYTTLKAALIATTEDTGAEYAAAVDNIITLAESLILRDLDTDLFDPVVTTNFAAGNPLLTKPVGTISTRELYYVNPSNERVYLTPKTLSYIYDYWPNPVTTTATPKFYAEYSATQWYIGGTPSGTEQVVAQCIIRPAGMTSSNTTTWLGSYMGDLLFYACLVASEEYLKADDRINTWKTEYTHRIQGAVRELGPEKRERYTPIEVVEEGSKA